MMGKACSSTSEAIALGIMPARTQKVQGMIVLSKIEKGIHVPAPFMVLADPNPDIIRRELEKFLKSYAMGTIFVRPCPVRPRHGFVDSRALVIADKAAVVVEVGKIYSEAIKADPEAELLISPAIPASHNIILTPFKMAVGYGNDGATAGKRSILVPLAGVLWREFTPKDIKAAKVDMLTEDPYIELVVRGGGWKAWGVSWGDDPVFCTQIRAGVKLPATIGADYIPEDIKVEEVIEASGDLLEWEKQVQNIKRGTVVYHLGGTIISHYGVHCTSNKIPILTTRIPKVGEDLRHTTVPDAPNPEAVIKGLLIGASDRIDLVHASKGASDLFSLEARMTTTSKKGVLTLSCNQASVVLMVCAHNASTMSDDAGYWIGIAASLMMRLGMAASHGEARHRGSSISLERDQVYNLALNDFMTARRTLGHAQWRFQNESWGGSYGGPKWADCTESLFTLDTAIRGLLTEPTPKAVNEVVAALNHCVTRAHNGGWWLNKFVNSAAFDLANSQSINTLGVAAPAMLELAGLSLDDTSHAAMLEGWGKAGPIDIKDPKKLKEPIKTAEELAAEELDKKLAAETAASTPCPAPVEPPKKVKKPGSCDNEECWECNPELIDFTKISGGVAYVDKMKAAGLDPLDWVAGKALKEGAKAAEVVVKPSAVEASIKAGDDLAEAFKKLKGDLAGTKTISWDSPDPFPSIKEKLLEETAKQKSAAEIAKKLLPSPASGSYINPHTPLVTKHNLGSSHPIPMMSPALIQGRNVGGGIHIQFSMHPSQGYYSADLPLDEEIKKHPFFKKMGPEPTVWTYSFSGSKEKYFQMYADIAKEVTPNLLIRLIKAGPPIWLFNLLTKEVEIMSSKAEPHE